MHHKFAALITSSYTVTIDVALYIQFSTILYENYIYYIHIIYCEISR